MSKLQRAVGASKKTRKKKKAKRKDAPAEETEARADRPPSRSRARRAQKPAQAPKAPAPAPKPKEEPEAVQAARKRLKELLAAATKDAPPEAVGLVLAIVVQETGSHKAANILIDEYELEKTFGIKKF